MYIKDIESIEIMEVIKSEIYILYFLVSYKLQTNYRSSGIRVG